MTLRTAAAGACAAALLAGCGGSGTAALTVSHSQNANNVRVCQHYRIQRAWVKNLAEPTMADALKFATWVAADAGQATPGTALARDLGTMHKAELKLTSSYAASRRVVQDCEALGVTFQP